MKPMHLPQKNIFKTISLAIFTAVTVVSCSTLSNSSSKVGSTQPNISGTQWTLAGQVKGNKPTLIIESAKLSGNGGCNNYIGELVLDPTAGNFSAKNIGSTRKACEHMDEEGNFFTMLGATTKYVVTGNTLELYKDKLLLLKFTKL